MLQENNTRKIGAVSSGKGRALYINREKRKKRKKLFSKIIVWAILIAVVSLVIFGITKTFKFVSGLFKDDFEFSYSVCENWPEHNTLSEIKKDYAIGIQYPIINGKTDKSIEKHAEKMLKDFKSEIKQFEHGKNENRPVYTVNYSIVKNSDIYVSLLYTIHRHNPVREIDDIQYIAKIYDISSGKDVSAEQIFDDGYNAIVSDYVIDMLESDSKYVAETTTKLFTENTKAEFSNFSNIGFTENAMTVYFSAGDIFPTDMGELTISIPMSKIYKNMKINVNGYTAPLYDADKPMIALTFDDGPRSSTTSRILDVLESVGGRATFFILGERVASEKEMIIRGDQLGCEYGNHSWNHTNLSTATEQEVLEQLNNTDEALMSVIGKKSALVRAPYAATNEMVFNAAGRPFVGWVVDTMDWDTRNSEAIKNEILSNAVDGNIILLHDIYADTAAAVEQAIPELIEQGFQLVTVSELLEARNITPVSGKVYHSARKK